MFLPLREIGLAIVGVGDVVLARQEEHLFVGGFDDLIGAVPLFFFGKVADITGMHQESGLCRHRLDLVDRLGKCRARVGIGRQMKADMAVADLHTGKSALRRLGRGCIADQTERPRHPAA